MAGIKTDVCHDYMAICETIRSIAPTYVFEMSLSPDFVLQSSIANTIERWGKGGGLQFDSFDQWIPKEAFGKPREINKEKQMRYEINGKTLKLNGKEIEFPYEIREVAAFDGIIMLLLMQNEIPDNNIVALDTNGNLLWNIADVVQLEVDEAYVGLGKEDNRHAWVRSVSEVETTFDVYTKEIIEQEVVR